MKKIVVLIISVFILFSCSNDADNEILETNKVENTPVVEKKEESQLKAVVSEISNTLEKIENQSGFNVEELSMINSMTKSLLNNNIVQKAIEKNDTSLCNALDEKESCISRVVEEDSKKTENIETCSSLESEKSIANCKRNVILYLANKNNDIKVCDLLENNTEENSNLEESNLEGSVINECRDNILYNIAVTKKDKKECEKISDIARKSLCTTLIDMDY